MCYKSQLGVPVLAQEGSEEVNTLPNIVLVHGAWADGSSWSAVIERLQADGYHVTAPQFPMTALAADVARLRQVLGSLALTLCGLADQRGTDVSPARPSLHHAPVPLLLSARGKVLL